MTPWVEREQALLLKILRRSEYCQPLGIFMKDLLRRIKIHSDVWPAPNKVIWIPRLSPSFYSFKFEPEACQGNKKCSLINNGICYKIKRCPSRIGLCQSTLSLIPIPNYEPVHERIGNPGGPTYSEKRMRQGFLLKMCFIDPTKQKSLAQK